MRKPRTQEQLEAHRAQARAWYAANKERHQATGKLYAQSHPEVGRASCKKWYAKNKQRAKVTGAKWYAENRERKSARGREYYIANRERILAKGKLRREAAGRDGREIRTARSAKWKAANRDKVKASVARRYAADPEKVKAQSKRWKDANLERSSATAAKWRAENPEKWKAAIQNWRLANPERNAIYATNHQAKRRARIAEVGNFTHAEWRNLLDRTGHKCVCCGIPEKQAICRYAKGGKPVTGRLTVDHIMPLSKGGSGQIFNIQPLCVGCNLRKLDKHINYLPAHLQSSV